MTREELIQILEDLGSSPNAVADSLRKNDVKGKVSSSLYCPVANYLNKMTGTTFLVGDSFAFSLGLYTVKCLLPFGVKLFVDRFDRGVDYQDLAEQK